MRTALLLTLSLAILTVCGDDSTTDPTGPMEISVIVSPGRVLLDISESFSFTAFVYGTANRNVIWLVQDIPGGNSDYGTIDQDGLYSAPPVEPDIDSVRVTAISQADSSKSGYAYVVLIDPSKIYVGETGSDSTGTGSRHNPFRTITYALTQAMTGQTVIVKSGLYDLEAGEIFPIEIPPGVVVRGSGLDSTFVVGPGGNHEEPGSVFSLDGDAITVEGMNISTADDNGVGIWLLPGILTKIRDNHIGPNYIGIAARGDSLPRPIIESNVITGDTIGISTGESSEPLIRNNQITDCGSIGVLIFDSSRPDLGTNDSTDAGGNIIQDISFDNQWLLRNESPDTIWAVGNEWVFPNPEDNDEFIYDDDENANSGPVLLINQ
jgi:parallel beta-helix repeat protein